MINKILFVCNQGVYRSKTAEDLFKGEYETKSAGIFSVKNPLTKEKLDWADLIITMKESQRGFIAHKFPKEYMQNKILCWEIEDIYNYNDGRLTKILRKKMELI